MKIKTIILTFSLLLAATSSFAMKKADFIKSGYILIAETEHELVLTAPDGSTVVAQEVMVNGKFVITTGKDGKDYFVLK